MQYSKRASLLRHTATKNLFAMFVIVYVNWFLGLFIFSINVRRNVKNSVSKDDLQSKHMCTAAEGISMN